MIEVCHGWQKLAILTGGCGWTLLLVLRGKA